jgi:hypothetical protein
MIHFIRGSMDVTFFWILLSSFTLGLIAFIGAITLIIKDHLLKKIIFILVGFAAGTLLGNAIVGRICLVFHNRACSVLAPLS